MKKTLAVILAVVTLGVWGPPAWGAGFQVYFEQSAAAMGQAAAVAARAASPSAVFYNPAAAGLLPGTQIDATVNGLIQQSSSLPTQKSIEGDLTGAQLSEDPIPIPAFHLTHQIGERAVLGLGVNTPYGSSTDWAPDWSGRYYADYTSLRSVYTAPTLAYRLNDRLALGLGLLAVWGEATVEKAINAPLVFASAVPDLAAAYISGAFNAGNDIHSRLEGDTGVGARGSACTGNSPTAGLRA